jgi:DNA transposition AAA+ family ATPase
MTEIQKKEIQLLLNSYIAKQPSQAKAARMLRVADGTLIAIRKGDWEKISDQMWRSIGKQVGYSQKEEWKVIPTRAFNEILTILDDAQETSCMFAFTAQEGAGKDTAIKHYASDNPNVYVINCSEYYNRKRFLSKILAQMGKDNTGTVSEMMDQIIEAVLKQEKPLLIFNEADKLSDQILYFLISFYNEMENKCAIVLTATDYLAKRIQRGKTQRRKGYAELYSRVGRKIIPIEATTRTEIKEICEANGISDPEKISYIYNEYEGDLRRVSRLVYRFKKQSS